MLTTQQANRGEVVSLSLENKSLEDLLTKEWLLSNDRGSYASSTVIGCNTRRYHGGLMLLTYFSECADQNPNSMCNDPTT